MKFHTLATLILVASTGLQGCSKLTKLNQAGSTGLAQLSTLPEGTGDSRPSVADLMAAPTTMIPPPGAKLPPLIHEDIQIQIVRSSAHK